MRELERHAADPSSTAGVHDVRHVAVVGRGRLGSALVAALADAGLAVDGPLGRGAPPPADAVLLCVPDREIQAAADASAGAAPLIGHTSGATRLGAIAPATGPGTAVFGLHPLQTFTGEESPAEAVRRLRGAGCAVAGSTTVARRAARSLAERLGMTPLEVADEQRPAYHAAASIASNLLVALEDAAESAARGAGMSPSEARRILTPLVRATVDNWARLGPERALTGPVARGDEATVAAQRAAVARTDPSLVPLFDSLTERARMLAARASSPSLGNAEGSLHLRAVAGGPG